MFEDWSRLLSIFFENWLYDVLKVFFGYLIGRVFYDKIWKSYRWGGWTLIINNDGKLEAKRDLSATVAEKILTDKTEFSVHVKGVISPYVWLNKIDISSERAENIGLVTRNIEAKQIIIDTSKNPSKESKQNCPPIT